MVTGNCIFQSNTDIRRIKKKRKRNQISILGMHMNTYMTIIKTKANYLRDKIFHPKNRKGRIHTSMTPWKSLLLHHVVTLFPE